MAKKPTTPAATKYPREGFARVTEAAEFLAVSPDTIYRMAKSGELPSKQFRESIRIPWKSLHDLMPEAAR